ncbi:MAG: phosphate/phosphite/phosphonate ABC transporter substrate-binding protein [Planctomycetaceae bacterium]|nr:phosphate/phosphite/phosphonate ABC transporter substrate-binding protein [Planctomycetaceae bacterium]
MYRLSYYPWLTQNVPQAEIAVQINVFARAVEAELAKLGNKSEVQVLPPAEVPDQIEQVVGGGAEIFLMNPLGFVFARNRTNNAEAVAIAQRIIDGKVGVVYFAQLYAHKKSAIRELKDAIGRTVGYGHSYSTSNFLIPAFMLREAGIHPLFAFSRIEFLKGHEIVARAVYEGKVDLGAGHDGVLIDLSRQPGYGDAQEVLIQIARSKPIPSDPVVVTIRDAAERALVQKALVAAGKTPQGVAALKIFWGNTQGLEPTDTAFYNDLIEALKTLKLDQGDLLPPKKP